MSSDGPPAVWIYSTRDLHNDGPACRLVWGPHETYASVAAVRRTAEDLFTCAAYAELIGELIRAGLPGAQISRLVGSMIGKRDTAPYLGHKETIQVFPAGSSKRRCGVVLVSKGSMRGELDPGEARAMGRVWLAAAEASEADTLFDRVLRRAGWLGDAELQAVFELLSDVREGNADLGQPKDGPL